jgi:DNA processing protein
MENPGEMEAAEALAWLVLNRLHGIAGKRCWRLVERFGSARAALAAGEKDWEEVLEPGPRWQRPGEADCQWAADQWRLSQDHGAALLTMGEGAYPGLLREIAQPPPLLFVLGHKPLPEPAVAIVGPRRASEYGLQVAYELARGLAREGVCVVSGLAAGVDAAAHRGALDGGGKTLAVLGCGVDVIFPAENRSGQPATSSP